MTTVLLNLYCPYTLTILSYPPSFFPSLGENEIYFNHIMPWHTWVPPPSSKAGVGGSNSDLFGSKDVFAGELSLPSIVIMIWSLLHMLSAIGLRQKAPIWSQLVHCWVPGGRCIQTFSTMHESKELDTAGLIQCIQ